MKIFEIFKAHRTARADAKWRRIIETRNKARIKALITNDAPIRIEFGAGSNRRIPGWTYADWNTECDLSLDLTKPLPLMDGSVSEIYSCHLLEHLAYPDIMNFLSECLRILKPGGVFKAAVPNARIYIEAYLTEKKLEPSVYLAYKAAYRGVSMIDHINYIAYMDGHHKYMFDEENLVAMLKLIGFGNSKLRSFDPVLDLQHRDAQSLYVFAEKIPASTQKNRD